MTIYNTPFILVVDWSWPFEIPPSKSSYFEWADFRSHSTRMCVCAWKGLPWMCVILRQNKLHQWRLGVGGISVVLCHEANETRKSLKYKKDIKSLRLFTVNKMQKSKFMIIHSSRPYCVGVCFALSQWARTVSPCYNVVKLE